MFILEYNVFNKTLIFGVPVSIQYPHVKYLNTMLHCIPPPPEYTQLPYLAPLTPADWFIYFSLSLFHHSRIRSLTTQLSTYTSKRKRKGKQEGRGGRGRLTERRPGVTEGRNKSGRTSKRQRRRQTGKKAHHQD